MKEHSEEESQDKEGEQKLHAVFSLIDFRAGHWPGFKIPPWFFYDIPKWRKAVEKMVWQGKDEIFAGTGTIQVDKKTHEIDVYARRDPRHGADYFAFAAYPKGKSFSDFWDEKGRMINKDDEKYLDPNINK